MARINKTWMYTLNNYSEEEITQLANLSQVSLHVCAKEIAPSTGTPHLQGRITFRKDYTFNMWKCLNPRINVRIAFMKECNYERKEGNIIIDIDNRKKKSGGGDLSVIADAINEGNSINEIAEIYPSSFIRYHKGIERLHELINNESEEADYDLSDCCDHINLPPLEFGNGCGWTHMVVGESGIGKTQYALSHFKKPLFVTEKDDLKKFNRNFHDGIVFDDMDFKHWPVEAQIHITDYDNSRSIKCRYGNARIGKHTKKIFTCNSPCFDLDEPAVARRVTVTAVCER